MDKTRKIMPLVAQMIAQLDALFVEFVGPIGFELAGVALKKWLDEGKTGPSALRRYAQALSEQLDNPSERKEFLVKAERLLLQLQSGLGS
jgi:hypothetical protein